jgi:hypothetical protein
VERIFLDLDAEKGENGNSKYAQGTRSKSEYRPGIGLNKANKPGGII